MNRTRAWLFALACSTLAVAAQAADVATEAMQLAYAPYRVALFRTNIKAQAESEQAIARTRDEWKSVVGRFGVAPPAPYDRDARFAATLGAVAAVYAQADAEIRDKRLGEAHETLERARDLLADLRRRNGVVTYSDHMNAYHAAMEHLIAEAPKLLAAPQAMLLLMARAGALELLAQRLRSEAPPAIAGDARFTPMLEGVEGSVAALREAILAQDAAAVGGALGKLKGPYGKLFLDFG